MKLTDRVYRDLTHAERFQAAMEAFGRRDWAEVDRLNDTVIEVNVRAQNPAYFERLRGFQKIAMLHGLRARDLALGWFASFSMFMVAEQRASQAVHEGSAHQDGGEGQRLDDPADKAALDLGLIAARLVAHSNAWAAFCEQVGVDPRKTDFAYYDEALTLAGEFFTDESEFERDEEHYTETLARLREMWSSRLDRVRRFGPGPEMPEARRAS